MASITKRARKDGSVSYLIRVLVEQTAEGKQRTKSMTWRPAAGMRASSAEKEAARQAVLFEERVKQGLEGTGARVRFGEWARHWLETQPLAVSTRNGYGQLMKRIEPALGDIWLDKLTARDIERFYAQLREPAERAGGGWARGTGLGAALAERGMSLTACARAAGVSRATVTAAARGGRVQLVSAQKMAAALGCAPEALFGVHPEPLSGVTLVHYHRLICAMLAKAKRERLVACNVAAEQVTAPRAARKEARYLDEGQARALLRAVLAWPDVRVQAALTLLLFTGMRKGELCGLSWPDIDFAARTVQVRRASQWQPGRGVVEVDTKTPGSVRTIDVPPLVTEVLGRYRAWWQRQAARQGASWRGGELERLLVREDGRPLLPRTVNGWVEKVARACGLPPITPHSLRHTFATLQISAGVDVRTLQARTGHAQASTLVNIYSHSMKSAQRRAAAALETLLAAGDGRAGAQGSSSSVQGKAGPH